MKRGHEHNYKPTETYCWQRERRVAKKERYCTPRGIKTRVRYETERFGPYMKTLFCAGCGKTLEIAVRPTRHV